MRIGRVAGGLIALMATLAAMVAVLPSSPGTSLASVASVSAASAPCTKRALEGAMRRAHTKARIATPRAFGCARGFAYAFAVVGSGTVGYEENLLFRASRGRWKVVSRARYCKQPIVPARIKKAVCYSS